MAWKRWNRSLYVRPQAWWTPIGLLAVIGPSRKLQCGPPAFWARRRAKVARSRHSARTSCSSATRSGRAGTGRNMRPRVQGGAGRLAPPAPEGIGAAAGRGLAILPAMPPAHETLPRGRSPFAAAFLSLLFPGLGHVYLGAYRRGLGFAAGPLLVGALIAGFAVRMTQFDLAGL